MCSEHCTVLCTYSMRSSEGNTRCLDSPKIPMQSYTFHTMHMDMHDFCLNTHFIFRWNVVVLFAQQQEVARRGCWLKTDMNDPTVTALVCSDPLWMNI